MNPNEEIIVRQFFVKDKRDRWRLLLNDPRKRSAALGKLNHMSDLDPACVTWMKREKDIVDLLKKEEKEKGRVAVTVYVMTLDSELDGQTMPLDEAVEKVVQSGWGAILLCVPSAVRAYYYDEEGMRRALLKWPGSS